MTTALPVFVATVREANAGQAGGAGIRSRTEGRALRRRLLIAVAAAMCVAGCASSRQAPLARTTAAAAQPLRDLNVLRDPAAPALEQALLNPYAAPSPRSCAAILAGIAELDQALGPDLDDPAYADADASTLGEELAEDAIRGLVGLPYRGVIRRMSGAAEQDRRLKRSILAGFARRSYLKGIGDSMACSASGLPNAAD